MKYWVFVKNFCLTLLILAGLQQYVFAAVDQTTANLLTGLWNGIPVTYKLINGQAIYQEDIILGKVEPLPNPNRISANAATVNAATNLWPKVNGVATVYYSVSSSSSPAATAALNQAISQFNADFSGLIQWIPRANQAAYVNINFTVGNTSGLCEASVGYQSNNTTGQLMQGAENCDVGVILHEMGHAIGLWHEQSRSDRDAYVNVNYQNISKRFWYAFDKQPGSSQNVGIYDYASLMHYQAYLFSRNGGATIETIPPGMPLGSQEGMPQVTDYSTGDKEAIQRLYGAPPSQITVTSNPPGLTVSVDGVNYTTPHVFNWALNSSHSLSVAAGVQTLTGNMDNVTPLTPATFYYTYGRWSDNNAQTHTIKVQPGDGESASPATAPQVSTYSVNFIQLVPYSANVYGPATGTPGTLNISPTPISYTGSSLVFLTARQPATLTAQAAGGWNFYGISGSGALGDNPKIINVPDYGPTLDVTAYFTKSPVYSVNVTPSAANANMYAIVDGNYYYTPRNFAQEYDFGWTPNSAHTLNMDNPVYPLDADSRYVFSAWSDGGSISHSVTLPSGSKSYNATVTPQYRPITNFNDPICTTATLAPTSPTGDGFYTSGQKLTLSASSTNAWSFAGWGGDVSGNAATTSVTVSDELLLNANYNIVATPLAIASLNPVAVAAGGSGQTLTIQGSGFTSSSVVFVNNFSRPATFVNANTLKINLSAAEIAATGNILIMVYNSWSSCSAIANASLAVYQGSGPLVISTPSVQFGSITDGTAATPITITLNNVGTLALNLNNFAITGANAADFSINNALSTCSGSSTLQSTAICTLVVNFTPSASGTRTASLQINDNIGGGTQNIALSGIGTSATVTLVPLPWGAIPALAGGLGILMIRALKILKNPRSPS